MCLWCSWHMLSLSCRQLLCLDVLHWLMLGNSCHMMVVMATKSVHLVLLDDRMEMLLSDDLLCFVRNTIPVKHQVKAC